MRNSKGTQGKRPELAVRAIIGFLQLCNTLFSQ
jgi:hypothetical protein